MKRLLGALCVMAAGALALPAISQAATATGTLNVTATMSNTCTVGSPTLNFGDVTGLTNPTATTNISVTCTANAPYSVALGGGAYYGSPLRNVRGGASDISYALYSDSSLTTGWGDGVTTLLEGNSTVSGTGNGLAQDLPVYGKLYTMPGGPAGTYTDTVAITVSY